MYKTIKNRKLIPYINYITYNKFWQKYLTNEYFDKNNKDFFIDIREKFSFLPEYVYEPYLNSFKNVNNINEIIEKIANNFLKLNAESSAVVVKESLMEQWQSLISLCSAVPFIARVYFDNQDSIDLLRLINTYSILPVTEKFDKETFNLLSDVVDLHIHINGTSETFYSWEEALLNPKKFIDSYSTKKNNSLEQLLSQEDILIEDFFDMLELSKYVRGLIKYSLKNNSEYLKIDRYNFKNSIFKNKNLPSDYDLYSKGYYSELVMWFNIFAKEKISKELEALIHFYLLAQSQFERILVQQTTQNGFRQFLYISDNNVRDGYEDKGFKDRFRQLKHIDGGKVNLEIRITPKGFSKKIESIINEYNYLLENEEIKESSFQISVVCHFIKLEEESYFKKDNYVNVERYAKTKAFTNDNVCKLLGEVSCLLNKTVSTDDIGKYFVGIDAAGNELYSPAESFSPGFRLFRKRLKEYGKNIGITFHAGEDFVHLISGIRYIYEVITFLEYEKGDRIGHANALGLNSELWREKLNNTIFMKRGEWLDNLIFFAFKTKTTDKEVLENIKKHWNEIYQEFKGISIDRILNIGYAAYNLRKYDYKEIDNGFELESVVNSIEGISLDNDEIKVALKVYYLYLYETYNTYDEYIEVILEEKFDFYITSLQNMLLRELSYKGVVIESMISSNVRICFYDRYREHHIIKWLDKKHNMPMITLASDDPGIFNNNIFIEYSHLYEMTDYNEEEFYNYIDILKKNGSFASFNNIV